MARMVGCNEMVSLDNSLYDGGVVGCRRRAYCLTSPTHPIYHPLILPSYRGLGER